MIPTLKFYCHVIPLSAQGKLEAPFETHFERAWKLPAVFLAAKGKVLKRRVHAEGFGPVDGIHELRHLACIVAGGVETGYQTTHTAAGDIIHRDTVFFQPADDADVRQANCGPAGQHQTDLGPFRGRAVLLGVSRSGGRQEA